MVHSAQLSLHCCTGLILHSTLSVQQQLPTLQGWLVPHSVLLSRFPPLLAARPQVPGYHLVAGECQGGGRGSPDKVGGAPPVEPA